MNARPYVHEDGFVTAKVCHTMGGEIFPLALTRYGSRYYFRELGPSEERTKCSFNINADDLRRVLDQADAEKGTFGDVCWLGIGCEGGLRPKGNYTLEDILGEEEEDDDEDEVLTPEEESCEPKAVRRYVNMKLEDFL